MARQARTAITPTSWAQTMGCSMVMTHRGPPQQHIVSPVAPKSRTPVGVEVHQYQASQKSKLQQNGVAGGCDGPDQVPVPGARNGTPGALEQARHEVGQSQQQPQAMNNDNNMTTSEREEEQPFLLNTTTSMNTYTNTISSYNHNNNNTVMNKNNSDSSPPARTDSTSGALYPSSGSPGGGLVATSIYLTSTPSSPYGGFFGPSGQTVIMASPGDGEPMDGGDGDLSGGGRGDGGEECDKSGNNYVNLSRVGQSPADVPIECGRDIDSATLLDLNQMTSDHVHHLHHHQLLKTDQLDSSSGHDQLIESHYHHYQPTVHLLDQPTLTSLPPVSTFTLPSFRDGWWPLQSTGYHGDHHIQADGQVYTGHEQREYNSLTTLSG
ncbi:hypothetical protein HDE_06641 [Halotydeus destructor]|nr:hypothetical protein HDE_06641 [Halotydeus destructor]